jgi:hypothetical protein
MQNKPSCRAMGVIGFICLAQIAIVLMLVCDRSDEKGGGSVGSPDDTGEQQGIVNAECIAARLHADGLSCDVRITATQPVRVNPGMVELLNYNSFTFKGEKGTWGVRPSKLISLHPPPQRESDLVSISPGQEGLVLRFRWRFGDGDLEHKMCRINEAGEGSRACRLPAGSYRFTNRLFVPFFRAGDKQPVPPYGSTGGDLRVPIKGTLEVGK